MAMYGNAINMAISALAKIGFLLIIQSKTVFYCAFAFIIIIIPLFFPVFVLLGSFLVLLSLIRSLPSLFCPLVPVSLLEYSVTRFTSFPRRGSGPAKQVGTQERHRVRRVRRVQWCLPSFLPASQVRSLGEKTRMNLVLHRFTA